MTEFVKLDVAIKARKGNFIATCVASSDLKAGTGSNGDYTFKKFTLKDDTAEVQITCWNDETELFEVGNEYEIVPWWKEDYNGEPNVGLGKYGEVKLIGKVPVKQDGFEKPTASPSTTLPKLEDSIKQIIDADILLATQIEQEVKASVYSVMVEGAKIGMYTRMIFYHLKGMDVKD